MDILVPYSGLSVFLLAIPISQRLPHPIPTSLKARSCSNQEARKHHVAKPTVNARCRTEHITLIFRILRTQLPLRATRVSPLTLYNPTPTRTCNFFILCTITANHALNIHGYYFSDVNERSFLFLCYSCTCNQQSLAILGFHMTASASSATSSATTSGAASSASPATTPRPTPSPTAAFGGFGVVPIRWRSPGFLPLGVCQGQIKTCLVQRNLPSSGAKHVSACLQELHHNMITLSAQSPFSCTR